MNFRISLINQTDDMNWISIYSINFNGLQESKKQSETIKNIEYTLIKFQNHDSQILFLCIFQLFTSDSAE